jgi:hypothetical protein
MSAINASLREFGDGQYIVAYVEVDNPAYQRIRHFKSVVREVPYFDTRNKGKQIGTDFYFERKNRPGEIIKRFEALLGVRIEK